MLPPLRQSSCPPVIHAGKDENNDKIQHTGPDGTDVRGYRHLGEDRKRRAIPHWRLLSWMK
jgi:hypothetical protein